MCGTGAAAVPVDTGHATRQGFGRPQRGQAVRTTLRQQHAEQNELTIMGTPRCEAGEVASQGRVSC